MKWIFFILIFFAQVTLANVLVQSTVDRNQMGMGDTLTLSVSVQSSDSVEVQEPRVPNLSGFDLVSSWNSSSSSSKLVQGAQGMQFETVRRQDFNYMLTPQRQGKITIPGFEVIVEGKTYTTKPILVQVSAQGSGAAQAPPGLPPQDEMDEAEELFNQLLQRRGGLPNPTGRNIPINPNEAFFIQCDIDKTDVFEGEQIVVNWYIYTRGNLLSLDRLKFPDLKGFWKEIIEEVPALNFTQEVVNGVPYRRALLASHALFPIRPGNAIIDEYKIKAQVQLPSSPFGAFGFGKPYSYQKSSQRINVTVRPLPVEGKPSDFSGAVGQFEVRTQIEGNQFPVNQPFSLKVRFEGAGNAKLIELPTLNLPKTVEIYDTKADSKYFKNGHSYKEFEVLLIPREQGELTIPAMSFSMFDPVQKKYVAKKTEAIPIKIIASTSGNVIANSGSSLKTENAKPSPGLPKPQLPDILISWDLTSPGSSGQSKTLIWSLVYLFVFIALGWKARKEFGWGQKQRDLRQEIHKRLKKVATSIENSDWRKAGTEMANTIYHVLGEVSGQGGASLEINKLMDQVPPSLRREIGSDLNRLIEITQILSFAPEGVVGKYKESSELKKNAAEIEKILMRALQLAENKTGEGQD